MIRIFPFFAILLLAFGGVYPIKTYSQPQSIDIVEFPTLKFERKSSKIILFFDEGHGLYGYLPINLEGDGLVTVNVDRYELGGYRLTVRYSAVLLDGADEVNISIEFEFLLYKGMLYKGRQVYWVDAIYIGYPYNL